MHSLTDEQLIEIIRQNPINRDLLEILPTLGIPHSMLVAGALFQTFWNHRSGQPPEWGIKDYDIAYFDADLSWEAENRVIARLIRHSRTWASTLRYATRPASICGMRVNSAAPIHR